ncbi:hypothetical protein Bca4012_026712 [Brassica carinata]
MILIFGKLMFYSVQNAIQLEEKEKEKREKELRSQIIEDFHKKMELACENNKAANWEKEKGV